MKLFAQLLEKLQKKDLKLAESFKKEFNEMLNEIEALKAKEKLFKKVKFENENLVKQINELKKQDLLKQWKPFEDLLLVGKNNPNYKKMQKIRDDFVFAEKTEELDFNQLEHNLNALKPYQKIGFFDETESINENFAPTNQSELTNENYAYFV